MTPPGSPRAPLKPGSTRTPTRARTAEDRTGTFPPDPSKAVRESLAKVPARRPSRAAGRCDKRPLKLGIIGCGTIAPAYLEILTRTVPGVVEVVACADLRSEAARSRAQEFGIPRACTTQELLDDPEIVAVANLTQAPAHHVVNLAVIRAGKHLFSEKPLALTREEGQQLLAEAKQREVAVAGAADIFLGPALQRARSEIAAGAIGAPIAAVAVITTDCFDNQHYHDVFRGALLDVGPYHLGAMTYLLGPITRVAASAEIRFAEKPFSGPATQGSTFLVDQASTTAGVFDFESGAVGTLVATQDAHTWLGRIEIFGTTGVLILPDPVLYGGTLVLRTLSGSRRVPMPLPRRFRGDARGFGVLDLAQAVRAGRRPRATARGCTTFLTPHSRTSIRREKADTWLSIRHLSFRRNSNRCCGEVGSMRLCGRPNRQDSSHPQAKDLVTHV